MEPQEKSALPLRWAQFRFAVIGPLLAAPPEPGALAGELARLAARRYEHPIHKGPVSFSGKTLERWYYLARRAEQDPITALLKRRRKDRGEQPAMKESVTAALRAQYRAHPSWSRQLHFDNLVALAAKDPSLLPLPSYTTVRRFLISQGLSRQRRQRRQETATTFAPREVRSYEAEHAHALWHLDFHMGSLAVLSAEGEWQRPRLLGILDDHSRLCCHLQWYFHEDAECLVHGLSQAMLRRGLPRALLSDNGSAMEAEETKNGLLRLGVLHEQTLPYSPHQNGKQEVFWGQVEGRLLAMLEGLAEPTLAVLNRSTLVWVELEYNRKPHRETHEAPVERLLKARSLERPCPSAEALLWAFTVRRERKVRGSDGTISLEGKRYELPNAFRNLRRVVVRYARWDLGRVFLVDPETEVVLAPLFPLDKARNADGLRRSLRPPGDQVQPDARQAAPVGPAPLLRKLLDEYQALGLSLPYLPKDETEPFEAPPAREEQGS